MEASNIGEYRRMVIDKLSAFDRRDVIAALTPRYEALLKACYDNRLVAYQAAIKIGARYDVDRAGQAARA
jgi:hypothetical protein